MCEYFEEFYSCDKCERTLPRTEPPRGDGYRYPFAPDQAEGNAQPTRDPHQVRIRKYVRCENPRPTPGSELQGVCENASKKELVPNKTGQATSRSAGDCPVCAAMREAERKASFIDEGVS
jgi:hypothetical protein